MSDFDDDAFSLGDESSENEDFSLDDNDEHDDFAEDSTVSDASGLEDAAPLRKKARVSRPEKAAATSSKPKNSSSSKSKALSMKTATSNPTARDTTANDVATTARKSPVAPKLQVMTAQEAETAVLEYMRKMNRPFSLLNVFENMHRVIAKSSLTKLLETLVIKQELASKTYGKATIYYVNQNNLPTPSEDDRMAVEKQIQAITAECSALEHELKSAEAALAAITAQSSDADLETVLNQLEEDAENLEKKAEALDQPGRAPVSPGRKDLLKCKVLKHRTAWVARKRIAMDGVHQIADGMEKKPKAVVALIGLETDEDVGIKALPSV